MSSRSKGAPATGGVLPPPGVDPVVWPSLTPFRQAVYAALCRVPPGRVITYGALARAVGCGSARAVGQALRHNPLAPRVPCHRVIAADGSLGGFNGRSDGPEPRRKRALLEAEGVAFTAAGRVAAGTPLSILDSQAPPG